MSGTVEGDPLWDILSYYYDPSTESPDSAGTGKRPLPWGDENASILYINAWSKHPKRVDLIPQTPEFVKDCLAVVVPNKLRLLKQCATDWANGCTNSDSLQQTYPLYHKRILDIHCLIDPYDCESAHIRTTCEKISLWIARILFKGETLLLEDTETDSHRSDSPSASLCSQRVRDHLAVLDLDELRSLKQCATGWANGYTNSDFLQKTHPLYHKQILDAHYLIDPHDRGLANIRATCKKISLWITQIMLKGETFLLEDTETGSHLSDSPSASPCSLTPT